MSDLIEGFHHLTGSVEGAQDDLDFYTKVVGQKLVKQTILLDGDRGIYHLYYADDHGTAGTIVTSFPMRQRGIVGRKGSGQMKVASYTVPTGSLEFWKDRFERLGITHGEIGERFGQRVLHFTHPAELEFEMLEADDDPRRPYAAAGIADEYAVRGVHSVTLSVRDTSDSEQFMYELGFRKTAEEGARMRFEIGAGGANRTVDFLHEPDRAPGTWTYAGKTWHHVAFAVRDEEAQLQIKSQLDGLGYPDVSEVKDRNYFRSIYVRMPGGVLFEFARNDPQGFAKDEPADQIGQKLLLPQWKEDRRDEIVAELEPISVDPIIEGKS
ncbi:MAG: Glyoxalase [Conexibacter sp.]|nr:Glyoxalase [Conexibacter sp.]